jgi:hypothetical protein
MSFVSHNEKENSKTLLIRYKVTSFFEEKRKNKRKKFGDKQNTPYFCNPLLNHRTILKV